MTLKYIYIFLFRDPLQFSCVFNAANVAFYSWGILMQDMEKEGLKVD